EDAFVRDAAAPIVSVAAFAVIDAVARGGLCMLQQAIKQRDAGVVLSHQRVAEAMGDGEGAQGADGVDEERMRAVERMDEAAAIADGRPARGLDGARELERERVVVALPCGGGDA